MKNTACLSHTARLASRLLALLSLFPLSSWQETAPPEAASPVSISAHEERAGKAWSIRCHEAPLEDVLRSLAREAGLALLGSELLPAGATLSLDLRRRPLETVLEYALGSLGLRAELAQGTVRILPGASAPEELLELAEAAWKRLGSAEDEPASVRARLALGNLAELRGDLESAFRLYREIAEGPPSDETAEATWRAGHILAKLGHWAEAAAHFRSLAAMEEAERFQTKARLELARVSIELGDAQGSLHLLNSLDTNTPPADAPERAERALVRAQALEACRQPIEALRTLEENELEKSRLAHAAGEVRAQALEDLGYRTEAARAWILFARDADPAVQNAAFERAGRLALEAGDELGALFVCREAARAGADEGLGPVSRAARSRLGLDEDELPASNVERLERAEEALAAGDLAAATELFESLYLGRGALPEDDRARVLAGWARCASSHGGLEHALELLSRARETLESAGSRRRLDLAAAAMLEEAELFERAAEAYRGVY